MIAVAVVVFQCLESPAAKPSNVRNILFIAIDDLKPVLGCYGDTRVKSPNIDRLAESGTVFLNAHCQQAVCGPSRASLLTGLRPDRTKVWDLKTKIRDMNPDVVTLPQYFRSLGFTSAGTGKVFDPRSVDKKLDERSWYIPFSNPDRLPFAPEDGWPVLGAYQSAEMQALLKEAQKKSLVKYGEVKEFLLKHDAWPVTECADVSDNAYIDGAIANEGIRLMKKLKKENKPFFLAVGFKKPHLPFVAPKRYWDLYARADFKIHPYQQKSAGGPEVAYHGSGEIRAYTGLPDFDSYSDDASRHMPEAKQQELMHGYHACVSYVDALVGKLLSELKELDLDKNTVIVLWGDHGWHFGDHGLWCKHTNFEQATHSPLIFVSPDFPKAGKTQAPAEFVDLFPTLCELAGVPILGNLDGTSLVPLMENPTALVKDFAVSQWPAGDVMGYAIRDERYRYVEWLDGYRSTQPYDAARLVGRELYDYQNDPMEKVNVVDDPGYTKIAGKMSCQLHEYFNQQRGK